MIRNVSKSSPFVNSTALLGVVMFLLGNTPKGGLGVHRWHMCVVGAGGETAGLRTRPPEQEPVSSNTRQKVIKASHGVQRLRGQTSRSLAPTSAHCQQ